MTSIVKPFAIAFFVAGFSIACSHVKAQNYEYFSNFGSNEFVVSEPFANEIIQTQLVSWKNVTRFTQRETPSMRSSRRIERNSVNQPESPTHSDTDIAPPAKQVNFMSSDESDNGNSNDVAEEPKKQASRVLNLIQKIIVKNQFYNPAADNLVPVVKKNPQIIDPPQAEFIVIDSE